VLVISRCTVIATFRAPGYPPANLSGVYVSDGNELLLIDTGTVLTAAMKMALTSTENKRFRAQDRPGPIFMLGGAPTAHDGLSECGFLPKVRIGPHSDNPCLSGVGILEYTSGMSLGEFLLENFAGDLEYHPRRAALYLGLGMTATCFWVFSSLEKRFTPIPLVFALGSLTLVVKGVFLLRKSSLDKISH